MKIEYPLVALIWGVGFAFYLWILTRHPLIYGIDGPYYLIQVGSLLKGEGLKYGDPPLAFLLFAFFTVLVGDVTLGIRIGVALFSSLSAVPVYFIVKEATKAKHAGYVAMLACIFSVPHIRMMNDLLKNVVGACFLLFFVYYIQDLALREGNRRNLFFAAFFLILTGITHILDFGVALLFLGLYPLMAVALNFNKRSFLRSVGVVSLILGFFVAAAFLVFPSLFTDFYKGISFLSDLFSASAQSHPIFFLLDSRSGGLIIPVLVIGAVLTVYEWRGGKKGAVLTLSTATIVGTLLSLPFIPQQWLWRFLLMEFIPLAIIIGYGASKMERKIAIAIFLILCISPLVYQSIEESRRMHPTINEEGYRELEMIERILPSDSVVIAHMPVAYWIQYIAGCDIAKRPSPDLWNSYSHAFILHQKRRPLPKLPQGSKIRFNGREFILIELPRPRFL